MARGEVLSSLSPRRAIPSDVSSRRASEATHRAARASGSPPRSPPARRFASVRIRSAQATAASFSARLRLPMFRRAQLTPFFTYGRGSDAPRSIRGRSSRNAWSGAVLSWTASPARSPGVEVEGQAVIRSEALRDPAELVHGHAERLLDVDPVPRSPGTRARTGSRPRGDRASRCRSWRLSMAKRFPPMGSALAWTTMPPSGLATGGQACRTAFSLSSRAPWGRHRGCRPAGDGTDPAPAVPGRNSAR